MNSMLPTNSTPLCTYRLLIAYPACVLRAVKDTKENGLGSALSQWGLELSQWGLELSAGDSEAHRMGIDSEPQAKE
jgi:hypothetical protein